MISIVKSVYSGYRGDEERHLIRIVLLFIISLAIGLMSKDIAKNNVPTIVSAISILAGFSFTALFSSHALAVADLPNPRDENDRFDLERLRSLTANFRDRSRYFIALCVLNITILIVISFNIDIDRLQYIIELFVEDYLKVISLGISILYLLKILFHFLVVFSIFIFFESIYTFYRLAETIIAMMDTRRIYFESARDK